MSCAACQKQGSTGGAFDGTPREKREMTVGQCLRLKKIMPCPPRRARFPVNSHRERGGQTSTKTHRTRAVGFVEPTRIMGGKCFGAGVIQTDKLLIVGIHQEGCHV